MNQKIQISLTGRQTDETGETSVTKHEGDAEYFERNGSLYLFYDEIPDGTETVVKNTIKLKNSVLELTKRGAVSTRMVFEPGQEYLTDYATPFGCLKMGIFTRKLEVCRKEESLEIKLDYSLTSGGVPVSDCSLDILACSVF